MSLPAMPPLHTAALGRHEVAHTALAQSLESVHPSVRELFRRAQRRVLIEALAAVELVGDDHVVPPRRRYLSRAARARLGGCEVAFRHVDSRLALWRDGRVADVVGVETPMVVHALSESHDPDRRETNPGLVRRDAVWFDPTQSHFDPPPGHECGRLLDSAVAMANEAPAPAVVRAGWLCATVLAIHPFVDGNGRTARLLFHTVNSSDSVVGVDWGSLEVWARRRSVYVAALKESQSTAVGGVGLGAVDPAPFMQFALDSSISGAEVARRRLQQIEGLWDADWKSRNDVARLIELAVFLDSTATIDELDSLVDDPRLSMTVNELVDDGRLAWDAQQRLRCAPSRRGRLASAR